MFANLGRLGVRPEHRDQLVAILTRPGSGLATTGCLAYEVGVDDARPDTVLVFELWESARHHRASLGLPEVRSAIAEAMPLLSGQNSSESFEVLGSPLRPES